MTIPANEAGEDCVSLLGRRSRTVDIEMGRRWRRFGGVERGGEHGRDKVDKECMGRYCVVPDNSNLTWHRL